MSNLNTLLLFFIVVLTVIGVEVLGEVTFMISVSERKMMKVIT